MNDLTTLQSKPVSFIELAFGDSLWSKQKEIALSVRDNLYTSVRSCHGTGKSHVSGSLALWFLHSFPYSKVISTAPTYRQVEDVLWMEIRSAKQKAKVNLGGRLTKTRLDIAENWFAVGLSTDDPDRFVGYHAPYIFIIVDEAFGIAEPIFEAIEGIISSGFVRVLYIGNPTAVAGTAYQSFRLANVSKISISAFDTPNFTEFGITLDDIRNNTWREKITGQLPRPYLITPEWVADKFERWGEGTPMWDVRVMGDFPRQGDRTLIPLSKIEAASIRQVEPLDTDPEQIGADIARFGTNKTIFYHRKGPKIIDSKEFSRMDTMETAARLYDFSRFHPYGFLLVDEVGVGAGVIDRLKQLEDKRPVEGVNVGLPANDTERFFNLRAEIYWNLRERFMKDDIAIPNDDDLKAQLAALEFEYTPKGQIKIETKEEMQKRGLSSPDKADALALAFGNFNQKPGLLEFMQQLTN
jgi:phage terminase large subunit